MPAKKPTTKKKSVARKPSTNFGLTILLVEDEPILINLYMTLLKKLKSAKVLTANEEGAALQAASKNVPQLVLLDLMIPSVQKRSESDYHDPVGLSVLRKIKSNASTRNTKVVILSNLDADEHRRKAEQLGADGYFVKAMIPPEELLRRVVGLLG